MNEASTSPSPYISGMNAEARYRRRNGSVETFDLTKGSIQVHRTGVDTVIIAVQVDPNSKSVVLLVLPPVTAQALGAALSDPECGRLNL